MERLGQELRDAPGDGAILAWTPETPRMKLPEELAGLADPLEIARERGLREDLASAEWRVRWLGVILAVAAGWEALVATLAAGRFGITGLPERMLFGLRAVFGSTTLGLALLGWLIFGFIPWYQAHKRQAEFARRTPDGIARLIPLLRFETWLASQHAPLTRFLMGLIGLVWLAQWWSDGSVFFVGHSAEAAGLAKAPYHAGQWWRLFTAPLVHGGLVHFLMNGAALLYLGKRLEVLARWPHLPLVFLFAACVGGETSARFVQATSVGASGGLMGWLGFLIVFETLHRRLVPRSARRRLVAGVILTGLIGLLGYRFIDNAAHLGGLLAGIAYALIVFPRSVSAARPGTTLPDRVAGSAALLVLIAAAAWAIRQILTGTSSV
jgi:membrane associated rhomboid family serine protease